MLLGSKQTKISNLESLWMSHLQWNFLEDAKKKGWKILKYRHAFFMCRIFTKNNIFHLYHSSLLVIVWPYGPWLFGNRYEVQMTVNYICLPALSTCCCFTVSHGFFCCCWFFVFFFLFFLFSLCQKNHTVLLIFNYLTVFLLIIDVKSMHLFFHTDCVLFPFLVFLPFKAENMCKKRKHQRRNNWINNEESLCVALCILQMTPC